MKPLSKLKAQIHILKRKACCLPGMLRNYAKWTFSSLLMLKFSLFLHVHLALYIKALLLWWGLQRCPNYNPTFHPTPTSLITGAASNRVWEKLVTNQKATRLLHVGFRVYQPSQKRCILKFFWMKVSEPIFWIQLVHKTEYSCTERMKRRQGLLFIKGPTSNAVSPKMSGKHLASELLEALGKSYRYLGLTPKRWCRIFWR